MTYSAATRNSSPFGIVRPDHATPVTIISRTFSFAWRNLWFSILVYLTVGLVAYLALTVFGLTSSLIASSGALSTAQAMQSISSADGIIAMLATVVVNIIANTVILARIALTYRAEPNGFRAAYRLGLKRLWRIVGVSVVLIVLLVITVLIVALVLSFLNYFLMATGVVARSPTVSILLGLAVFAWTCSIWVRFTPLAGVVIDEDEVGIFGSIFNSADLTKGKRWSIFFAGLLLALLEALIFAAIIFVGIMPIVGLILLPLISSFFMLIALSFVMAVYFELIAAKGGYVAGDVGGDVGAVFE